MLQKRTARTYARKFNTKEVTTESDTILYSNLNPAEIMSPTPYWVPLLPSNHREYNVTATATVDTILPRICIWVYAVIHHCGNRKPESSK